LLWFYLQFIRAARIALGCPPVSFEITAKTRHALAAWIKLKNLCSLDYLFPSSYRRKDHINTRHYGRLVKKWVCSIGLDSTAYGTHSMRRTKVALIYRQTKNLRAVQILLGHLTGFRKFNVVLHVSTCNSRSKTSLLILSDSFLAHAAVQ
jgi:hypothetical protein